MHRRRYFIGALHVMSFMKVHLSVRREDQNHRPEHQLKVKETLRYLSLMQDLFIALQGSNETVKDSNNKTNIILEV